MYPATELYLDLMKRCLTNWIYGDAEVETLVPEQCSSQEMFRALAKQGIRLVRPKPFDPQLRAVGRDWPPTAHTMIGLKRLDNLQCCVEDVLAKHVPGDLMETGVWRGGASIFMRAVLKAHGITDRRVWVADSFAGLPPPNPALYPDDAGDRHHTIQYLAVSLEQVRANFARYDLLDEQVRFLQGWFRATLPQAPVEQLAVLRLDGDMYESTMDALVHLYPKLSPGGYLIIDDYGAVPGCRQAVHDYRTRHGIQEEVRLIDWGGVYWQRGESKREQPMKVLAGIREDPSLSAALAREATTERVRLPPEERHPLRVRDRMVEVPFRTRGRVDREILYEVWEADAYGVGSITEPPATVLDIGAHIGAFALLAATAWPQARVLACECDPDNALLLRKNMAGYPNVELVEAAILGAEVTRVEFHTFLDKVGRNSGGGSCLWNEPESVTIWVPALSVVRLWETRQVGVCDLLKLDCEGTEIPILAALGQAGLLPRVRRIVGEWHALAQLGQDADGVQAELRHILEPTHEVLSGARPGGTLGYFVAQAR